MTQHSGKLRNMASIYLLHENKILLLYRQGNSIVRNLWIGSAGGHFEEAEVNDARHCVLRELKEEINLDPDVLAGLQLRYITLRYTDGEIRQNYYFFAELSTKHIPALASTEGICQWFSLTELSDLPMPFTARHMIDHYLAEGQFTDHLYAGIADNQQVTFCALS